MRIRNNVFTYKAKGIVNWLRLVNLAIEGVLLGAL
jgi:hypothetical protein